QGQGQGSLGVHHSSLFSIRLVVPFCVLPGRCAWGSGVTNHLRSLRLVRTPDRPGYGDGSPRPGLGLGGQDLDDVGRQQLAGLTRDGTQALELSMDRLGEGRTGVRYATTDDDVIDVVGHDQEMDRPGEAA